MTRSALVSPLGSEFDDFLFAQIGEDRNGVLVSVLSALARLDIDPWEEAAELAELPEETATRKLSSLIAALPDGRSARPDPETIAPRLIALLPRRAGSHNSSRKTVNVPAVTRSPVVAYVIHYTVFIVIVLLVQWLMTGRQAAAPVGKAPVATSSTILPQTSPPISDQRR
jgi:hypothetical protein